MEPLLIVLLTVAIGAVVVLVAWYGPRRRHWKKHEDLDRADRRRKE